MHVIGHGYEAVFELNCPAGPLALRENYGFPKRDLARFQSALAQNLAALCRAWEGIHGFA